MTDTFTRRDVEALIDAREKAPQGEVFPYSEPEVNYLQALHVKTSNFHEPFAHAESRNIERFIELAANTAAPLLKQLLGDMDALREALEHYAGNLDNCDVAQEALAATARFAKEK